MPLPTSRRARSHQADLAATAAEGGRRVAALVGIRAPWSQILTTWANYQLDAAQVASRTMADWLDGEAQTIPEAYAGVSSYGFPISEPLVATIDKVVPAPDEALPDAWWDDAQEFIRQVEQLIASEIRDAARSAEQAEMVAQGAEEYIRLLNPPSCKRCVPMAGRIYRWAEAFDRHPDCDCIHVPLGNKDQAIAEGFILDPMELFDQGLITGLSKADTQAITDGADITEVINATRGGLRAPGITSALTVEVNGRRVKATTAGTTKRGRWRQRNPTRLVRLRPETIYRFAKDTEDARRLLRIYGYLNDDTGLPVAGDQDGGGQLPAPVPSPAPDAPGDAAGGDGDPPVPPRPLTNPEPDPDEPPDTDRAYWLDRASRTGADLGGETEFTGNETRFLERFVRDRGEQITWIPTDPEMRPTNDFTWHSNGGIEVELKSPQTATYRAAARRIETAVHKARAAGVTKENFLIDLGAAALTEQLREDLGRYNVGRTTTQIAALWVLSENGTEFEQIDLEN